MSTAIYGEWPYKLSEEEREYLQNGYGHELRWVEDSFGHTTAYFVQQPIINPYLDHHDKLKDQKD